MGRGRRGQQEQIATKRSASDYNRDDISSSGSDQTLTNREHSDGSDPCDTVHLSLYDVGNVDQRLNQAPSEKSSSAVYSERSVYAHIAFRGPGKVQGTTILRLKTAKEEQLRRNLGSSPAEVKRDDARHHRPRQHRHGAPQEPEPEAQGSAEGYAGSDRQEESGDEQEGGNAEDDGEDGHTFARRGLW